MADAKTVAFDKAKCVEHLASVEKEVLKHAGKKNNNPFLWVNQNIDPLRKQLEAGSTSLELQEKILALKAGVPEITATVDVVPKGLEAPVKEAPVKK